MQTCQFVAKKEHIKNIFSILEKNVSVSTNVTFKLRNLTTYYIHTFQLCKINCEDSRIDLEILKITIFCHKILQQEF